MSEEKLDKEGLKKVWLKIWSLLKVVVGDVDVEGKGDLQTQIDDMENKVKDCFRNASDGKKLIADAITGKGVSTSALDTFATMAENISNIKETDDSINEESLNYKTGYNAGVASAKVGTAVAGNVLDGKTFTNAEDVGAAGTMANRAAVTVDAKTVTQDANYTYLGMTEGYYNANSKVRTPNSNLYDGIYTACVSAGSTPSSKTPGGIVNAIGIVASKGKNHRITVEKYADKEASAGFVGRQTVSTERSGSGSANHGYHSAPMRFSWNVADDGTITCSASFGGYGSVAVYFTIQPV